MSDGPAQTVQKEVISTLAISPWRYSMLRVPERGRDSEYRVERMAIR